MSLDTITNDYHRLGWSALDDQRLVEKAAASIGVPRAEVVGDRYSFVFHAPLELLARAALLPLVDPNARELARLRIAALAVGYEESGPPLPPPPSGAFTSIADAAAALAAGVRAEDLPAID